MLHISKVSKHFSSNGKRFTALDDVSLRCNEGITVILGPSGCGKSTLLGLIAGFSKPDEGKVIFEGAEIKGPSKSVGIVFQKPSLFPWMDTESNISFGPSLSGEKADHKKLLLEVGLSEFGNHYPFMLSIGMQQRVALARALANKPKILLMDEPFAALDAITRRKMASLMLEIHKVEKMPIILVTHDIEEAITLGDRIIVMSKNPGKIKAIFNNPLKKLSRARENREKFFDFSEKLSVLLEPEIAQ
ncbi:MAG TPA: ABC transporter ATP-binding protein [archaeon]|nr:ABC transporter ATP-binding protein [archaeon]